MNGTFKNLPLAIPNRVAYADSVHYNSSIGQATGASGTIDIEKSMVKIMISEFVATTYRIWTNLDEDRFNTMTVVIGY